MNAHCSTDPRTLSRVRRHAATATTLFVALLSLMPGTASAEGTVVFFDGFETKDLSFVYSVSGDCSVVQSGGRYTTYGLELDSALSGASVGYRRIGIDGMTHEGLDLEDCCVSFAFRSASFYAFVDRDEATLLRIYDSQQQSHLKLELVAVDPDSGPRWIEARDANGQVLGTVIPNLLNGPWYAIDVRVGTESSSGAGDASLMVRVDGSTVLNLTNGSLGATSARSISFGDGSNSGVYDWFLDNVVILDGAWPDQEPHVRRFDPEGDVATMWNPISSPAHYTLVDDLHGGSAHDGDVTAVSSSSTLVGEQDVYALTDDLPTTEWNVIAVSPFAWTRDNLGLTRFRLFVDDPTGRQMSPNWDGSALWVNRSFVKTTRADGNPWTVNDMVNAEIGLLDRTTSDVIVECTSIGLLYVGYNGTPTVALPSRDETQSGDREALVPALVSRGALALGRPWPNPASDRVTLDLAIPAGSTGEVSVAVFDVSGRRVASIDTLPAREGNVSLTWDLRDGQGRAVADGAYFVRATSGADTVTRRVMILH